MSCLNAAYVLSQYRMSLLFVHFVFCPNAACVSGLSILCFVSMLPVSLVCPICVFSQYCLCLVCPFCVLSQYRLCLWLVHDVFCLNTACFSGMSILHLVSILPVSLICPFSITPSVFFSVCYRIKHCFF